MEKKKDDIEQVIHEMETREEALKSQVRWSDLEGLRLWCAVQCCLRYRGGDCSRRLVGAHRRFTHVNHFTQEGFEEQDRGRVSCCRWLQDSRKESKAIVTTF